MKVCKQCGEAKSNISFRRYYNSGDGRYTVCLDCEKINSRRKYLERKVERTKADEDELQTIYQLYEIQRANGLAPPRKGKHETGVKAAVLGMIHRLGADTEDISKWLTADLTQYTPEELDKVYDGLCDRYKIMVGIDPVTCLPIYDTTHRQLLCDVLIRFDEYEEAYYGLQ